MKTLKKISETVSQWRKEGYKDIEGFASSTTREVENNDYVLTPGRYVGFKDDEEDEIPFEEKFLNLANKYKELKVQSEEADKEIDKILKIIT